MSGIVEALETRRLLDEPRNTRFYYGVVKLPPEAENKGLNRGAGPGHLNRTAAGWDGSNPVTGSQYFQTFAHELGHCFGRDHAPTGHMKHIDPHYPDPQGRLDAAGLDVPGLEPKSRLRCTDIMGYGPREGQWVSAYTWEAVLAFLRRDPLGPPDQLSPEEAKTPVPAAAGSSLLVAGTLENGQVRWHPVFELPGTPPLPGSGAFRLSCLDRAGRTLLEVPFDAPPRADLPASRQVRAFNLQIPLTPDLRKRLATIEIHHGSRRLAITQAWGSGGMPLQARPRPAPGARQRGPVDAVRFRPGVVSLRWDAREYPALLVRDPRNWAIIARVQGGMAEVHTDAPELELIRSDGWNSDIVTVPVPMFEGPARVGPVTLKRVLPGAIP